MLFSHEKLLLRYANGDGSWETRRKGKRKEQSRSGASL